MTAQFRALRTAVEQPEVTLQIHPLDGPVHALTGKPALTLYRLQVPEIPDHVVREGGLPGTAEISDALPTVSGYRRLLDHSCAIALNPDRSKEELT